MFETLADGPLQVQSLPLDEGGGRPPEGEADGREDEQRHGVDPQLVVVEPGTGRLLRPPGPHRRPTPASIDFARLQENYG